MRKRERKHLDFENGFPPEDSQGIWKLRNWHARSLAFATPLRLRATRRDPRRRLPHTQSVAEVYCGCHFKISLSTFAASGAAPVGREATSAQLSLLSARPGLTSSKQFQFRCLPQSPSPSLTRSLPPANSICPNLEWLSRAAMST